MLEELLGKDVTVGDGSPASTADLQKAVVAIYVDDTNKIGAVGGMDLPLAAWVGAAIGLLPKGGAEDCVDEGQLTKLIGENVREVCNIMAALLNKEGTPHLRLEKESVFLPGEAAPQEAQARMVALGARLDLAVAVAGYGAGRLWISLAG
ncbi:hypothetical protein SAMN05443668_10875 [Cryptosporangium aurantiacum]|uniref:Uncharacterized protein n=2 Tax=Cryptosporangium aurantiacum TaxID=134849 RepID=A0A1M7R7J6_9ACTN|nr:hypothetical protein SAMN05443668_10875 [Cryptosporangium aurantiacum]